MTINEKMLKKILENDLTDFEESIKQSDKEWDDLERQFEGEDGWKTNEDYKKGYHIVRLLHRDYIKKLINLITEDKRLIK